jgi:tRNA nucleotidyltransferase (CCA-adding enzyme)
MRLILTHEQADFDAIASLLGKFLISKDEIALLPHQMNRNVQNFLNTYGSELPFINLERLPNEKIEAITLVDTQSLVTLKGSSKKTAVTVIDHHPPKRNLQTDWKFIETRTGATTTYFVQQLQKKLVPLNKVMVSLLLLGIHEDTGSLTYSSTTPEDIHAAAFLLEHGASLDLIASFLNPPLSASQTNLMDELVRNTTSIQVEGQTIIISHADGTKMTDEISSIAHKMFNLLSPTALFLFVITNEGIRLVARSVSDQINVANITIQFGGGGHPRAASALIQPDAEKSETGFLNDLINQFIRNLPSLVKPVSKVAQIMSRQPLLITPTTTAKEALQLMQQFGYEGYPVIQNQQVIGLLTRRAVDRAITHKLNLPAISLMDAGSITISPEDSLEKLQYLMSSSGWGQVPVVDSETKQVIGIVTRTDLLKSLAGGNGFEKKTKLTDDLEKNLSPDRLAIIKLISISAAESNLPIYLVGGLVRDILLKQPSQDLDFVVEGEAIQFAQLLAARYGGRVTSHRQFGTAKWIIRSGTSLLLSPLFLKTNDYAELPASIDLISARTEFYSFPTALPTVKQGSIKLDLQRRDFTINTMAIRLDGEHYGELVDYWGGLDDLKERLIRVLHSLSFVDDPTRVLRAIRFEQRLNFQLEERTKQLLIESSPLLEQVSGDRLRHEFDLILSGNHCNEILKRLQDLNLFKYIHPELKWDNKKNQVLESALKKTIDELWGIPDVIGNMPAHRFIAYLIIFSSIPPSQINSFSKRLRISATLKSALIQSNTLLAETLHLIKAKPSKVVKMFDKTLPVVLYSLYLMATDKKWQDTIIQFQTKWKHVKTFSNGETLKKMGLSPSPAYHKILFQLRSAWLDDEIHSKDEEVSLLNKLISEIQS